MKEKNIKIKWVLLIIIFTILICKIVNDFPIIDKIGRAIYPFILGGIFAFVLNIFVNLIEKRLFHLKKYRKKIRIFSIILSMIIVICIIVLINYLVIPQLGMAINTMVEKLPDTLESFRNLLVDFTNNYEDITTTVIDEVIENKDEISSTIQEIVKNGITTIADGIKNFLSKIIDIIIALVFSFYLLGNKEKLQRMLKKVIIAYFPKSKQKKTFRYLNICNNSFYNFITGQCKEAIILGTLCCLGMLILRIPYALVIGTITMFTAFIPIVGAWISGIFGFLLIVTVDPIKAIIFVIFIIVLQQLENTFIYPKVVGKVVKIPSMLVLVAITIGGRLFGIIGIILGVPTVSSLYIIFRENTNEKLKNKHNKNKPIFTN